MREENHFDAGRLALLLILANGEDDASEFHRISAEIAKHNNTFRAGVNEILTTVIIQLMKHLHPDDWLSTIRLQLLNLEIDPDHYVKDTR